ncbi:uncharacterized protein TNCV_2758041 [Trichonephila clavipes]|nr:uncharacterized protein TNCV_2758041 [Trichonephila clavipes]
MAQHKPRKSAPIEYSIDDEDMIMFDGEEELEPDPTDKFAITECHRNNPDKYIRALTPTRFRKTTELGLEIGEMMRVIDFKNLILTSKDYDEQFTKTLLETIIETRAQAERDEKEENDYKRKKRD